MICVIPKLSIFHISSMTHLHTYCNDRILEWRRNLLLRPWSWNRNLMKLTMQEQGQNAAAGEEREREGKKQEVSFLKIWPRPCRPSWGICTQVCLSLRTRRARFGDGSHSNTQLKVGKSRGCGKLEPFALGEKHLFHVGEWHLLPRSLCHLSILLTPKQEHKETLVT